MKRVDSIGPELVSHASGAQRMTRIALVGCIGLVALGLQPIPPEVMDALATNAVTPALARVLLMINPLVLVLVAAVVGGALAHRIGLVSVLAGSASSHRLGATLAFAGAVGLALGVALATLDYLLQFWMSAAWQQLVQEKSLKLSDLWVGVLYGGISEEIILRWGLMSLVAWMLLRWCALSQAVAMLLAIAASALVFGLAHLPALSAKIALDTELIVRTLIINGLAGVVFGLMLWRRHLEAAMAAHAATHVGMFAFQGVLTLAAFAD